MIGRESELGDIAWFLTEVTRGPAALVLAGEPGIGKTALWRAAVAQAKARSFCVLTARPVEAEAGLAFAALADLLEPVAAEVLPVLPEPQRRALAVALLEEEPAPEGLDPRAVAAGTIAALRALRRRRPVVLAVDDLRFAASGGDVERAGHSPEAVTRGRAHERVMASGQRFDGEDR